MADVQVVDRDDNHVTDTHTRSLQPLIAEALWSEDEPARHDAGAARDR